MSRSSVGWDAGPVMVATVSHAMAPPAVPVAYARPTGPRAWVLTCARKVSPTVTRVSPAAAHGAASEVPHSTWVPTAARNRAGGPAHGVSSGSSRLAMCSAVRDAAGSQ